MWRLENSRLNIKISLANKRETAIWSLGVYGALERVPCSATFQGLLVVSEGAEVLKPSLATLPSALIVDATTMTTIIWLKYFISAI